MEDPILIKIQSRFEALFDVLKQISPPNLANEHPFIACPEYINNFMSCLDDQISLAMNYKSMLEKEIEDIKNLSLKYKKDLKIDIKLCEYKDAENLNILKDLFQTDLDRLKVEMNKISSEIEIKYSEINKIRDLLGKKEDFVIENVKFLLCDNYDQSEDLLNLLIEDIKCESVSLASLAMMDEKLEQIKIFKSKLERRRQYLYDEIESILKMLKRNNNFTFEEPIFELKNMFDEVQNELNIRKSEYNDLMKFIRKIESYLGIERKEFLESYEQNNVDEMKEYYKFLKSEQSKQFDDIFKNTLNKLYEINEVFGLENKSYNINNLSENEKETVLEKMQYEIDILMPKREKFLEIGNIIAKRQSLLERMTEFEKIASDPKRLFKSSFQLNTEERFRNSAYPSLLKMEEALFKLLESYECDFGSFIYKGCEYLKSLRHEIDSRIINNTVFINRFDSPYKKKN